MIEFLKRLFSSKGKKRDTGVGAEDGFLYTSSSNFHSASERNETENTVDDDAGDFSGGGGNGAWSDGGGDSGGDGGGGDGGD